MLMFTMVSILKLSILMILNLDLNHLIFIKLGISLNIGVIGGNLFINFAAAGLVECPSYILTIVLFNYFGRRMITACYMLGMNFIAMDLIVNFDKYLLFFNSHRSWFMLFSYFVL